MNDILPNIIISAVRYHHFFVVTELLRFDQDLVYSKNHEDYSLFHAVSYKYSNKMFALLITASEKSRRLSLINEPDVYGYSPLNYAIKFNQPHCIDALLAAGATQPQSGQKAPIEADILEQLTIYDRASRQNYVACLNLYIRSGFTQFHTVKSAIQLSTPIHQACALGLLDQVQLFSKLPNCDFDVQDVEGLKPLDLALAFKFDSIIEECKKK